MKIRKYRVSVEKRMYSTGYIDVHAESAESAENLVKGMIINDRLLVPEIRPWSEPVLEIESFDVTGDVEQL